MINALSGFINEILKKILFYNITGDYGLSIILLTLLVNTVTFPLTRKQIQSSKKMQEIQPLIKKDTKSNINMIKKLNTATMEHAKKQNKILWVVVCPCLHSNFLIIISVFNLLRDQSHIIEAISLFLTQHFYFSWIFQYHF